MTLLDQERREVQGQEHLGKLLVYRLWDPEHVAHNWPIIRLSLLKSWPEGSTLSEEALANIQVAMGEGVMDCWMVIQQLEDRSQKILAVMTGYPSSDGLVGDKSYHIFSLFGFGYLPNELWRTGFEAIAQRANSLGCSELTAISSNARVIKMLEWLGGDSSTRLVRVPLGD